MSKFKAVIVGGSIAGQTLALAFQKADIDYILLEAQTEFAPQLGASVGLWPNGLRILDQLGLLEEIQAVAEPLREGFYRRPDGTAFGHSNLFAKMTEMHGYSMTFFERQKLLKIMYAAQPHPEKLITNKVVEKIEETAEGVKVTTKDGFVYEGDIVIGADGVRSLVRQHIWDEMDKLEDPPGEYLEDKKSMFAEYSCMFGISKDVSQLEVGIAHLCYGPGRSFLLSAGKESTTYWFMFEKMKERYDMSNIPRFTENDVQEAGEKYANVVIAENVKFKEIWDKKASAAKVAMEEGVVKKWHYGRCIALGDAVHKYTANFGQGANTAICSAAVLSNMLYDALNTHPDGLSLEDIDKTFEKVTVSRMEYVQEVFIASGATTRLEAQDGLMNHLMGRYILPIVWGENWKIEALKKLMVQTPTFTFLDKPNRPHSVPYLDEIEEKESPQAGWFSWMGF